MHSLFHFIFISMPATLASLRLLNYLWVFAKLFGYGRIMIRFLMAMLNALSHPSTLPIASIAPPFSHRCNHFKSSTLSQLLRSFRSLTRPIAHSLAIYFRNGPSPIAAIFPLAPIYSLFAFVASSHAVFNVIALRTRSSIDNHCTA